MPMSRVAIVSQSSPEATAVLALKVCRKDGNVLLSLVDDIVANVITLVVTVRGASVQQVSVVKSSTDDSVLNLVGSRVWEKGDELTLDFVSSNEKVPAPERKEKKRKKRKERKKRKTNLRSCLTDGFAEIFLFQDFQGSALREESPGASGLPTLHMSHLQRHSANSSSLPLVWIKKDQKKDKKKRK